jgi:tripartite-type tricarboxylate transporter receptor subunit TctC
MRPIPIRLLALFAALATLAPAPLAPDAAQDFPSRPVRFIVPQPPAAAAICSPACSATSRRARGRQQVVVDNRARRRPDRDRGRGAFGARRLYALSPPTLLTIAASLYKRVPYDWKPTSSRCRCWRWAIRC